MDTIEHKFTIPIIVAGQKIAEDVEGTADIAIFGNGDWNITKISFDAGGALDANDLEFFGFTEQITKQDAAEITDAVEQARYDAQTHAEIERAGYDD